MSEPLSNVEPVSREEILADPLLAALFLAKRQAEQSLLSMAGHPWWRHPISCRCDECRGARLASPAQEAP